MTTYNSQENQLIVTIPNKGMSDLLEVRRSILGLLGRVEIEDCNSETKGDLKLIYELLFHLHTEEEFIIKQQEVVDNLKSKHSIFHS